ncbi:hypothetical protein CP8484711_0506B, partial [Chlamydia psittaci 84-8471/1]
FFRE